MCNTKTWTNTTGYHCVLAALHLYVQYSSSCYRVCPLKLALLRSKASRHLSNTPEFKLSRYANRSYVPTPAQLIHTHLLWGKHCSFEPDDETIRNIRMLMPPLRHLIKTPAIFIKLLLISSFLQALLCTDVCLHTRFCQRSQAIYRAVSLLSPGLWPWW